MKKAKYTLCISGLLISFLFDTGIAQGIIKNLPQPPDVIVAKPKQPSPKHVWIPGHWEWEEKTKIYFWKAGDWTRAKKKESWVPGHWKKVEGGYQWSPGYWRKNDPEFERKGK